MVDVTSSDIEAAFQQAAKCYQSQYDFEMDLRQAFATHRQQAAKAERDRLLRNSKARIQALTAEVERLRKLLQRNIDNEPCRLDHHGYCQTHYLEEDCSVAAARAALQSQEKVG